jgi:membrane-bound serine protease (ClpP class)
MALLQLWLMFATGSVLVAELDGVISPASSSYLLRALHIAENEHAQCLIMTLDTPGGLDVSMREITKAILNADVPVVVYIAPSGARAASAGVFILYASHIAAMAPGTNTGAAHPVTMGGGQIDSVMAEKVTNDAVAYLQSIARERGRNVQWAEEAVRQSASVDAETALKLNICEILAQDIDDLIEQLHDRTVNVDDGTETLKTRGSVPRTISMTLQERLLLLLTNPNVAYILLILGFYGLFFELQRPGMIFPGVVGGISLILAFYALHVLPVNYAGVALIVLSGILFILEIYITSHGMLTIGGIVSLIIGSMILFESDVPFLKISWEVIVITVGIIAGLFLIIALLGIRAQFKKRVTGREGIVGEIGIAKTDITSSGGTVFVHGEFWSAVSGSKIKKNSQIKVTGVSEMVLRVERVDTV